MTTIQISLETLIKSTSWLFCEQCDYKTRNKKKIKDSQSKNSWTVGEKIYVVEIKILNGLLLLQQLWKHLQNDEKLGWSQTMKMNKFAHGTQDKKKHLCNYGNWT